MQDLIKEASEIIKNSDHMVAFTGAGISVESGIPPFRGENGLWTKYDPEILDINYFKRQPEKAWLLIKQIFYDYFGKAKPNKAHYILAELEKKGILKAIITQNIDNLHFIAGSKNVIEFHGNSRKLICTSCGYSLNANESIFKDLPPKCPKCSGILKPDFVFFGEPIPVQAYQSSIYEAEIADVFLLIGTSGVVYPASLIPYLAKNNKAKIIEINPVPSDYTYKITEIFINQKASIAMEKLNNYIL